MAGLEAIAKPWTDSNGKTRWYVNDWFQYIGITKKRVPRGRGYRTYYTSSFYYKDEELYLWWVREYIAATKVWIDDNLKVHVRLPSETNSHDYNPIPDLKERITQAVQDVVYCYA